MTAATVALTIDGLGCVVLRPEPHGTVDVPLWPVEGPGPVRLRAPVDPRATSGDHLTRFISQHMVSPEPNFLQLEGLTPESRAALINTILTGGPA